MKSWNSEAENPTNSKLDAPQTTNGEEDGEILQGSEMKEEAQQEKDGEMGISDAVERPQEPSKTNKKKFIDLSRGQLLRFLGIMEGEVQAQEYIIRMLKSEHTRPDALEAHYGSAVPEKALRALHRDGLLIHPHSFGDDIYELPMAELDRLEEKSRETYRRMLEQLLMAEKCHRRTVHELDNEKRKHNDYMNKSDDFTNLLEQERERLKRLLEQEKSYQARKDKDYCKQLEKVQEELVKLKSFTLMLVDERQQHLEQIDQQSQKVQELAQQLQEKEQKLCAAASKTKEDSQRIMKLEVDLEHKAAKFAQDHEEMTTKLSGQESQNRQLRLKLAGMTRRIEELEERNQGLQRSEEELQELRDKISKGECGNSALMVELETLRKRVLEMEGKDEEIIKAESQCRELKERLQDEENHCKELKPEVEKLQKRMVELEQLEGAFSVSKSECSQLHTSLEKERGLVKELVSELGVVKNHVKELEASESRLEKAEMCLKDDMAKLKSFTVLMVDERKKMAERIREEEKKGDDLSKMFKTEQCKVMEVTEKLIEESKKLLKLKSEMEGKVTCLGKEKEELRSNLVNEKEKCKDLSTRVSQMKTRIDHLEEVEREYARSRVKRALGKIADTSGQEDNRVKELKLEIERLKNRLKQLEVVEGDLMKTEDEYDVLERKFRTEQDKANVLSQQLEEMRSQFARNNMLEKEEAASQESEVRQWYKMEEAKTRNLQADVQALKEKIHELMCKEDQLSQLQVDYSVLQQRFIEEERKKTNMSHEVLNLTKELEVTKRYSRALRPSTHGRRMMDVPLVSTGVQTDMVASDVTEDTAAVFIRKSFQEENSIMSNLRQRGLKKSAERPSVLDRYPPAASELNMRKSWMPWMRKKDGCLEKSSHLNGESLQSRTMPTSQRQGHPLHIRVTPDHGSSTATLEITSPPNEEFFSKAAIIPTLGQKPRITIIPSPTKAGDATGDLGRAMSPVTITTISRGKSPETSQSDKPLSPISIVTVSTSAMADVIGYQEKQDMTMGRAVFKVTPENQRVPTLRKHTSNTNIITTTEDNKIHIHLGSQFQRPVESGSSPTITVRPRAMTTESKEVTTGTVLRSPRHSTVSKTTPGKVMSSITITPITSAPSRHTQSQPGPDAPPPPRTTITRIPISKEHAVHHVTVQPR